MCDIKESDTYWVKIYASGPIAFVENILRRECLSGLCVTIEQTKFIYTGGEEIGFCIGFINYPRFPETPEAIYKRAYDIALKILDETYQLSILLMTPDKTFWITKPRSR